MRYHRAMAKRREKGLPCELERAGELCLALANTTAKRRDERYRVSKPPPKPDFADYGDLLTWCQRLGAVEADDAERLRRLAAERPDAAAAVFDQGMELRAVVRRIFTACAFKREAAAKDLAVLNAAFRQLMPPRQVVPGPGDGYHLAWIGDDEALERPLWPILESAVGLLTSDDRRWVRQCADAECTRLFVDHHSRHRLWCDPNTCGSRARGKRHYRRGGHRR